MIGMGKLITKFIRLRTSVLRNARQNAGSFQKRLKYVRPTHSVP